MLNRSVFGFVCLALIPILTGCASSLRSDPFSGERVPASVDYGSGLRFSVDAHPYSHDSAQTESIVEITYDTGDSRVKLAHAKAAHTDISLINSIDRAIIGSEGSSTRFTVKRIGSGHSYKLHTLVEGKKLIWFNVTSSQVVCTESETASSWSQDCLFDTSHGETQKRLKYLRKVTDCVETATGVRCTVLVNTRSTKQTIMTVTKTAMEQAVAGALRATRSSAALRLAMLVRAGVISDSVVKGYAKYNASNFEACLQAFASVGFADPYAKNQQYSCPK